MTHDITFSLRSPHKAKQKNIRENNSENPMQALTQDKKYRLVQRLDLLRHKVKERELARAGSVLVNEPGSEVRSENSLEVVLGHTLQDRVEANLIDQEARQRIVEHTGSQWHVMPQIRLLELFIKVSDGRGELIRQDRARLVRLLVLAPDGFELQSSVVLDGRLNGLDVFLVELRELAVVHTHVLDEALLVESQRGKDLEILALRRKNEEWKTHLQR
jgi:hypothetical protein